MRKSLTVAMAALTFGGAVAATAAPAEARSHGYYNGYNGGYYGGGGYHHHHNNTGAAVAAGVVGLALGAALASSNSNHGYYNSGYSRSYAYAPYYGDSYYAQPRYVYRTCVSERWVWDPYLGEDVLVRNRYRC